MLSDIDQRDRQITRRIEDRKAERADENDVTGCRAAALPKADSPGQDRNRQRNRYCGMSEPEFFEISKTASPRGKLPFHGRIKTVVLEAEPAKCPHQGHVVDDVDHLAVDGRGLVGEIIVQWPAGGGEPKHGHCHPSGNENQHRRHGQAHGSDQADRRDGCDARRQDVPDEHVLDRINRIRCRRDAASQHSRQTIGKIVGRMARQVTEHVAAQITGDADERKARNPACNSPQKIVRGDQRHQQSECQPYAAGMRRAT